MIGELGFRDILAGILNPDAAISAGAVEIRDRSSLTDFTATFTIPYSDALQS